LQKPIAPGIPQYHSVEIVLGVPASYMNGIGETETGFKVSRGIAYLLYGFDGQILQPVRCDLGAPRGISVVRSGKAHRSSAYKSIDKFNGLIGTLKVTVIEWKNCRVGQAVGGVNDDHVVVPKRVLDLRTVAILGNGYCVG
jgi:hypothetical protein